MAVMMIVMVALLAMGMHGPAGTHGGTTALEDAPTVYIERGSSPEQDRQ